jgi:hypothetical protein
VQPPWIIWCQQRTGSIALFNALVKVSDHPAAESEPFDGSIEKRQFSDVSNSRMRDASLAKICAEGWLIKHVFDRLPLDFNLALARATTKAGYRHIHLKRRYELARLLSLGLAEQKALWVKCETTEQSIQDILAGKRSLQPLPIDDLIRRSREAGAQWRRIEKSLPALYTVFTEDIFRPNIVVRRSHITRLLSILGIDFDRAGGVDEALRYSGQRSWRLAHLVPNIDELRRAVAEEVVQ